MSRWLELDEVQEQELNNIAMAASPQLKDLHDRERANREQIRSMDVDDPDYAVQVQHIATDNGQIATELTVLLAQLRADIHRTLTPEQQQKMAEGAEHMKERFRDRHERHNAESDGTDL